MPARRPATLTAGALLLAALCPGCFIEGTAGARSAAGGVSGPGTMVGVNLGFFFDVEAAKLALGGSPRKATVAGSDGDLKDASKTTELRADATIAGRFPRWRATAAFGWGKSSLEFKPKGYSQTFTGDGTTYTGLAGFTMDLGILTATVGPSIAHVSNDFVGGTTAFGGEARVGLWLPLLSMMGSGTGRSSNDASEPATSTPMPGQTPAGPAAPDSDRYRKDLQRQDKDRHDKNCIGGHRGSDC